MSNNSWRKDWHKIRNEKAHEITGSTSSPGEVHQIDVSQLPSQLQNLPGIRTAYVSGYCEPYKSPEKVTVQGELVAERTDSGLGKGYVYHFGVSGSGVYFNGPYKPYDGHHFSPSSPTPLDLLFGKAPKPEGNDQS